MLCCYNKTGRFILQKGSALYLVILFSQLTPPSQRTHILLIFTFYAVGLMKFIRLAKQGTLKQMKDVGLGLFSSLF